MKLLSCPVRIRSARAALLAALVASALPAAALAQAQQDAPEVVAPEVANEAANAGPIEPGTPVERESATIAGPATAASGADLLANAPAQIDALAAEENWPEAIALAESVANIVSERSGPRSLDYAQALTRVADLQRKAGDYTNAELGFAHAVSLIEARSGGLSGRLIEPLRGLGFTYAAMDDHARAAAVLERAVLTTRRNRGLFDPSQLDMLAQLARSQTQIREFVAAEQNLRYRVHAAEQAFGPDDPRVSEPLSDLAHWYSRAASYEVARGIYRSTIERVEKGAGPDSLALVQPLRGLAENSMRAYVYGEIGKQDDSLSASSTAMMFEHGRDDPSPGNRRRLTTESEEALERALAILRSQPGQGLVLTSALLQAGDWYLVKEELDKAHARYSEALQLSRTDPEVLAATQRTEAGDLVLGYPVQIYFPGGGISRVRDDIPDDEAVEYFVQTEFTVGTDGRVENIEVIERDASDRKVRDTVNSLEKAVYRPQYIEGEPVVTERVRYRDVYRERRRDEG